MHCLLFTQDMRTRLVPCTCSNRATRKALLGEFSTPRIHHHSFVNCYFPLYTYHNNNSNNNNNNSLFSFSLVFALGIYTTEGKNIIIIY